MSSTTKKLLAVVSIAVLAFAYWFHTTNDGQTWRYNQQIEKGWNTPAPWEKEAKAEEEYKKEVYEEKESASSAQRMSSSGRSPIHLEGKRNYVTGKNVTFVVPGDMRRLRLTIQDKVGRRVSSYTLPNSFISIAPNQRINLAVE